MQCICEKLENEGADDNSSLDWSVARYTLGKALLIYMQKIYI